MTDLLHWLLSSDNFIPHGHCYLWQSSTLWLNVGSDALIAAAYYAIPLVLFFFFRRRRAEIAYPWIPLMFAGFIFLCGSTHIMEIWTVWRPNYPLAGVLKLLTGLVSVATLLALIWITPRALQLRTPRQLNIEVAARTAELADVNSRLRAEIAARDCAELKLRDADRRKDEFLATLAHELRNPLAPIRHSVRLLQSPTTDEPQRIWSREVISRQVNRMALLLDDLLDVSRITRGRLDLKKSAAPLDGLIQAAVETARPLLDAKAHRLTIDLPAEPVTMEVDSLRLSQALSNLLTNAAKYTYDGGQIRLAVRMTDAWLELSVKDTGIGFEPTAVPGMFEMFSQIDPSSAGVEGGLGIGLALARGLVELHGGVIDAASAGLQQGSEFTIRLPRSLIVDNPSVETAAVPDGRSNAADCRVLIVDDNQDAADSLALLLDISGYARAVAYTGAQALECARRLRPQVVILDIGLPDLDGYEVARLIRQEPWGAPALLIAMTGWGQPEDKERARAAGFDQHLTKPVDPQVIEALLREYCASPGQGRRSS